TELDREVNRCQHIARGGMAQDGKEAAHAALLVPSGLPRGRSTISPERRTTVGAQVARLVVPDETGWSHSPALIMSTISAVAQNLMPAVLDGDWSAEALRQRGGLARGRKERWLAALVRRVLQRFPSPPPPEQAETLTAFLAGDDGFRTACTRLFR